MRQWIERVLIHSEERSIHRTWPTVTRTPQALGWTQRLQDPPRRETDVRSQRPSSRVRTVAAPPPGQCLPRALAAQRGPRLIRNQNPPPSKRSSSLPRRVHRRVPRTSGMPGLERACGFRPTGRNGQARALLGLGGIFRPRMQPRSVAVRGESPTAPLRSRVADPHQTPHHPDVRASIRRDRDRPVVVVEEPADPGELLEDECAAFEGDGREVPRV